MSEFDDLLAQKRREWERSIKRENRGMSTISAMVITVFFVLFIVKMVWITFEPQVEGVTEYWGETKHPNGVITREKKYTFTSKSGGIILKKANNDKP